MNIIPAIDLSNGHSVQLEGGDFDRMRVDEPDPLATFERFAAAGFDRFHVIDLDAATGRGSNASTIEVLLRRANDCGIALRIGGGIRSAEDLERWFDLGATEIVVGSRALRDTGFREESAARFPRRVVLALDVRGRSVTIDGWRTDTRLDVRDLFAACSELPLAGALVTAVHVEGRLRGPDVALYSELSALGRLPLIASGGVTTLEDAQRLSTVGCSEAVVGLALHRDPLALPPCVLNRLEIPR